MRGLVLPGVMRGRAPLGRCYAPRVRLWLLSLNRYVIWATVRAPLGFKAALKVEISHKSYPIEEKPQAKRKAHEPGSD